MSALTGIQKILIAVVALTPLGGAYFFYQTGASTFLGITLHTNPDLERGLVGHWTFDGQDMDWSSTTAEVRDRSSSANHANATSSMSATSSPANGVLGQGMSFQDRADLAIHASTTLNSALELTGDVSFGTWFKADSFRTQDVLMYVGGGEVESTNTNELYLMRIATTSGNDLTYKHEYGAAGTNDAITFDANFATSTWYHVMFVRTNSDNTVKFYLNGALASSSVYVSDPTGGTFSYLALGGDDITNMDGTLDDVRIYNRELSAEEVRRIYGLGATTKIGQTLNENPSLESGLVGHWTFDGQYVDWSSTTAQIRDRSGNNNHGSTTATMSATSSPTQGVLGQGLVLDGVDDYVGVPDSSSLDITGDLTIAGWVWVDAVATTGATSSPRLIQKGPRSLNTMAYYLELSTTGVVSEMLPAFRITQSNLGYTVTATGSISLKSWHHIAGVRNGTTMNIYVNGVLASTTTGVAGALDDEGDLYFGESPGNNDGMLQGKLDDLRIYNRALSADEVRRIYGLGATTKVAQTLENVTLDTGLVGHWTFDGQNMDWSSTTAEVRDRSGNRNHGNATTTMSATSSPAMGVLGQAVNFDGSGDMLDMGDPSSLQLTGAMTVATWVYIDEYGVMPHVNSRLITKSGGSIKRGWDLNIEDTGVGSFQISGNGTTEFKATSTTAFATGVWIQYVGVYIPSTAVQLYANGILVAQNTTSIPASQYNPTNNVFMGDRTSCSNCFLDGKLDDVRIYNRALSASEIKRLYDLGR